MEIVDENEKGRLALFLEFREALGLRLAASGDALLAFDGESGVGAFA